MPSLVSYGCPLVGLRHRYPAGARGGGYRRSTRNRAGAHASRDSCLDLISIDSEVTVSSISVSQLYAVLVLSRGSSSCGFPPIWWRPAGCRVCIWGWSACCRPVPRSFLGIIAGGVLSDYLLKIGWNARSARARVPGLCVGLSLPFLLAAVTTPSVSLAIVLFVCFYFTLSLSVAGFWSLPLELHPQSVGSYFWRHEHGWQLCRYLWAVNGRDHRRPDRELDAAILSGCSARSGSVV